VDKPVCRLCGGRHYASEPHKFEVSPANSVNTAEVNRLRGEVSRLTAENGELRIRVAELESELEALSVVRPKRDRKAYMREYMRKRRAK
jgi:DnaJ-class molecular chaperone